MTDGEAAGADASRPGVLRRAREARGLSVGQVAEELRLPVALVEAMDEARWSALGPSVYARGHLRKYAALVGVAPAAALEAYDAEQGQRPSELIPPASVRTPVGRPRRWPKALVSGLLVLLVLLALVAAWWWYRDGRAPALGELTPAAEPVVAPVATPVDEAAPVDAGAAPDADPATGDATVAAAPSGPPPAAVPVTTNTSVGGSLRLAFAAECWVEVYDASGAQLAFGLQESGSSRTFGGRPPWRLVLGNAPAVSVAVDGVAVVIPPGMIIRRAASLRIDGQGGVQRVPLTAVNDG